MNIIETAARRRVTIAMIVVTFLLFGFIALKDLKVNLLPDLSYPTLTVRTEYTGAAPAEVENLISEPVEEAVGVVKGVKRVKSISRAGQSDVILEFAWGTNMDRASLEVRDKMEILQLPLEARKPVLLRFNPSTDPILRLALSGASKEAFNEAELKQLRRFADEELKKSLEPVEGVAAVKVGGGLEDEVQVLIDQQKLAQLNLSVDDVVERLRSENVNISSGRIEEGSQRYLVRTINQFVSIEQIRNMLIRVSNEIPVRMRDVADVKQGFKERDSIIRIDGQEAVELAIYKEGDANTVNVADGVNKLLEKIKDELPKNARLHTVDDQAVFIKQALKQVRTAAFEGGLLAILVIFFFLRDGWSTVIISLSLPVSIIATFFFMGQMGLSLNVMSLGGLALATGMVVDDSIVVLENIAKMRERGLSLFDAAVQGTSEVGMAVTASTLTTVAVFLPLVFVEGVAGQLFRDQALTVTISMLLSLVVAMTLIPMLASLKTRVPMAYKDETVSSTGFLRKSWKSVIWLSAWPLQEAKMHSLLRWVLFVVTFLIRIAAALFLAVLLAVIAILMFVVYWLVRLFIRFLMPVLRWGYNGLRKVGDVVITPYDRAAASYHRVLPNALERPHGWLIGSTIAFFIALALIPTLGLDLIPQLQQGRVDMMVKLQPGTPIAETDAIVREIQRAIPKDSSIDSAFAVTGSGTRLDANPTESGENIGRITIALKSGSGSEGEAQATKILRDISNRTSSAEAKFSRPQLFSFAAPLEIEIAGFDLPQLKKAGMDLAKRMSASDRFIDVKSSVEQGYPEIQIRFDQERAAALGLTTRDIADQVVRKVRGDVATRYSLRDRKIDVLVRANEQDRASLEDIKNLIVNPRSEKPVTLSSVAEVFATEGPSEINRVDQERVAIVSASLHHGDLGTAVEEVQSMLRDKPLGAGLAVHIGGQGAELDSSVTSLIFALGLAIFLVYLVMASQFESLLHPFVILFTIPLALVGAVLALKVSQSALSVVVFIGLILLVGIVVKNAIVLIDKVNQNRAQGVAKREAILHAAESRLRPIVMTTVCTLLGFLPLALGSGDGAEVRAPMAITVIGGLAVSTLLTLIIIPIVYDRLDRRPDSYYTEKAKREKAVRSYDQNSDDDFDAPQPHNSSV